MVGIRVRGAKPSWRGHVRHRACLENRDVGADVYALFGPASGFVFGPSAVRQCCLSAAQQFLGFELSGFFSLFPLGDDRCFNGYEIFGCLVYRVVEKAILVVSFLLPFFHHGLLAIFE